MSNLKHLFDNNRNWAKKIEENDPGFFKKLSRQQNPEYLWIGCSDSRVPANEIVDLLPGELFVHRNVANIVVHTDLNCLSVIQYAVDFLKVKHIIVCGHYSCGGVKEAFKNSRLGLIDNWLRHTQDVAQKHKLLLAKKTDQTQAIELLCELNVIEQVQNVCQTTIVQQAWERGQDLTVHGWIYGLNDGLIKDLNINIKTAEELDTVYDLAIKSLA
ncbi:MAG: carbonate dehydratase [Bacteroidetes bacterium]|nr:carbonate dehydratase [Bacteroidota bacterium]